MSRLRLPLLLLLMSVQAFSQSERKASSESVAYRGCTFASTGRNPYFVLEPGYQLVLEGRDGAQYAKLVVTVLHETKMVGGVETRVVEEKESVNGQTVEISRHFFAICTQANTVYYFGEEVDTYYRGKITGHEGTWIAEGNNKPGIAMPGIPLPGNRYDQEMAPGIAMDRAEILSVSEAKSTPAGNFTNCLKMKETSPLKAGERAFRHYAPGVGLIQEKYMLLVGYGFMK